MEHSEKLKKSVNETIERYLDGALTSEDVLVLTLQHIQTFEAAVPQS